MGLEDHILSGIDKFECDEQLGTMVFPCCVCIHRVKTDKEEPCRTCCHNCNAVTENE